MNKLQLIHYLQHLLETCNTLYDLQEKLIEDEINEKADIRMREESERKQELDEEWERSIKEDAEDKDRYDKELDDLTNSIGNDGQG